MTEEEIAKATKLFYDFHGREPQEGELVTVQIPAQLCLVVGNAYGVAYKPIDETSDGEKPYFHPFAKGDPPQLVVSFDGTQAFYLGGKYKFTDRGFIG